jgi:zinc protease
MQLLNKFKKCSFIFLLMPALSFAEVSEFKLDNGLKLIVKQDQRAPVVVSQVWYKIGSSYEHNGITGISHQLEHMMFKGTKNLKPNEFSEIIAANGGDENAFTGRDYTAYFQTLEKDRLEISFRLEAERMRNLKITEQEVLKEREVVSEERRLTTEDKPQAVLAEAFNATAFMTSPYHHPIIGWMSDINNYTVEELTDWYNKWYAPNNATVVVAGDVEPEAVLELAKTYFGPLKSEQIAVVKPQPEVAQRGKRTIEVKAPAQLPFFMMGWKTPTMVTAEEKWEPYALEVLSGILDGGDTARFSKRLVRGQEIAAGVSAGYGLYSRLTDLFIIAGTPAKSATVEQLKNAIDVELELLKTELVSDAELQRIKAQVVASDVYQRDSLFYQAMKIGMLDTVGLDWRLAEQYVERINAVTAEQIRQVANKYFIEDSLTVGNLIPLNQQTGGANDG